MRNHVLLVLVLSGLFVAPGMAQFEGTSNFPRWNFNAGAGYGIGRGAVGAFAGNTFFAVGGAGMNFSRMFGFDGEFMYYDITPRPSVSQGQGLGRSSGSLYAFSLDGLVRAPFHVSKFSPYGIFGVGFYDRTVSSSTGLLSPGAIYQPSWVWWDIYCVSIAGGQCLLPSSSGYQHLGSFSKVAGGYNFGGGITYDLNRWHKAKLYGEIRYHKAYQSDVQTIVVPITVGLRW